MQFTPILGILAQSVVSGGASYAAGGNHDLRVGFGRKQGETLPLYKDARAVTGVVSAIAAMFMGGAAGVVAEEVARGTLSSVTSTEAVRRRAIQAASVSGEDVTIDLHEMRDAV